MAKNAAAARSRHDEQVERRRVAHATLVESGKLATPEALPIAESRDELLAAIAGHQVVIVAGETGSGKSTQLPKLCLELGRGVDGLIGHTQPRRVAARTIAERVADEVGTSIGESVGYSVRFNDRVGDNTLVRVMTDGILLAELQRDRELRRYDTLIIDEAHERSLNIDFILGYLKQLLPRRLDLKVIVTSATIDTERFAAHFADPATGEPAPIVTVSGRTFPVEVRYRPPDNADQVQAVIDAVDELHRETNGDVLVFLSGEREIHDTADALRRAGGDGPDLEVLPLYARLSSAEQHRIFQPGSGRRRVVLSTNVAETSVTVPGIRSVVDAGTARISRYSRRLKVQRLPIEPISQASANQRAGRCGRVAAGVCIRLYDEDEFADRPEFTEPEVLRTNLASVILQMTALGLGDVAAFPFVEAPDTASVRDGYRLLEELGAIDLNPDSDDDEGRGGGIPTLTEIGRRLARLPVDPRLGRMVIESQRLGCVREVLVIASALSIQDPRERPSGERADERTKADELHRRFDVERSDLLSIVSLWDYLAEQQRELSGNRFRRLCRSEYLNYLRVREWRDLYSQLRRVAGDIGVVAVRDGAAAETHPDLVHQALLTGLLSHLGMRDKETREYRGARGSSFAIGTGSVLAKGAAKKSPPAWVIAAELVETNRLWARRVAEVRPEWAEQLGEHLVRRSYSDPRWDANSGRAVATETVMLYGLPIVSGRTIGYDRIDRSAARWLLLRHALVDGEWGRQRATYPFLAHNRQFAADVGALEARVRRGHLLDDEAVLAFYDRRVPDGIVSVRHFDRWWRQLNDPTALNFTASDLTELAVVRVDLDDYPATWTTADGIVVDLTYRYDQGGPLDGVTAHIPLTAVSQMTSDGFDWLIAGYRDELVEAMARTLPKSVRRELIPFADTVTAAAERLHAADVASTSFAEALAGALSDIAGATVAPGDFDPTALAKHLRMHFVVSDSDGEVHDAGDDFDAIRRRLAAVARDAVAAAARDAGLVEERRGITDWDLGTIPRVVEDVRDGVAVRAYPTLLDTGDSVALRVVTSTELQERVLYGGVRKLLLLTAAPSIGDAAKRLDTAGRLAVSASATSLGELAADCRAAAVDAVLSGHELPWDLAAFESIRADLRSRGGGFAASLLRDAVAAIVAGTAVRRLIDGLKAPTLRTSVADATAHLERLLAPGWVERAGVEHVADVERYLAGIVYRLERVGDDVTRDLRRIAEARRLESRFEAALARQRRGAVPAALLAIGRQLEELRVSRFAQAVGVRGSASEQRIDQALHTLGF